MGEEIFEKIFSKIALITWFFRIHCWNDFGKNVGSSCPDLELRYFIECLDQEGFDINHHVRNERSPFVCQAEEEKGISVLL